jgi:hypothetical protein
MNELNYTTLEASQRLVEKGIVLETEAVWCNYSTDKFSHPNKWSLGYRGLVESDPRIDDRPFIPAPSMAEVWRELPEMIGGTGQKFYLTMQRLGGFTEAGYESAHHDGVVKSYENTNPTDALVDLLVWIRSNQQ